MAVACSHWQGSARRPGHPTLATGTASVTGSANGTAVHWHSESMNFKFHTSPPPGAAESDSESHWHMHWHWQALARVLAVVCTLIAS